MISYQLNLSCFQWQQRAGPWLDQWYIKSSLQTAKIPNLIDEKKLAKKCKTDFLLNRLIWEVRRLVLLGWSETRESWGTLGLSEDFKKIINGNKNLLHRIILYVKNIGSISVEVINQIFSKFFSNKNSYLSKYVLNQIWH